MARPAPTKAVSAALLGLLCLSSAGICLLASRAPSARASMAVSASAARPGGGGELAFQRGREPVLERSRSAGRMRAEVDAGQEPGGAARSRPARKEREFLAGFLELARARPGALEARAAALLAAESSAPEKVAFLRALLESGSPESTRWLVHAVRTLPDDSSAEARSVPGAALALLARKAARDEQACALLAELAFEQPAPAPELRRQAASAHARQCPETALDALRGNLLREPDALLVSGVLASLAEREPTPRVERIRLDFPAARAAPPEE